MEKIVVLNHKSIMEYDEVIEYIKDIKDKIRTDLNVIVCPNMVYIPYFMGKYNFKLGSQNISNIDITGETTGNVLKSLNVKYSIINHPERKRNNLEENVNKKINEAINNNIIPIVCIGETKEEYLRKKTGEVIAKQLKDYFYKISFSYDIIIAYEPNYEVNNDNMKSIQEIAEIIVLIKNLIFKTYNIMPKVIYGGNIKKENIKKLNKIKELDGFLLGKISTNSDEVIKILDLVE